MADDLAYVNDGDPLVIPAATYNAFIDAARANRAAQRTGAGRRAPTGRGQDSPATVWVKNASGSDVGKFAVLGISGTVFAPTGVSESTTHLEAFKADIVLTAATAPSGADGVFVVTCEPIGDGEIGRAVISGATQVKVNAATEDDETLKYAEANGSATALKATSSGPARILWRDSGTGDKWAVVNIGAGATAITTRLVTLTNASGSDGDESTAATRKYDVADMLTGEERATDIAPDVRQFPLKIIPATAGIALVVGGAVTYLFAFESVGVGSGCDEEE